MKQLQETSENDVVGGTDPTEQNTKELILPATAYASVGSLNLMRRRYFILTA
jgi:hypothetical protein